MKRIDSTNKAVDLFGPGKHGFQGGNPALNQPATFFTPAWANHLQEEIANAIEYFGTALNEGSYNQLITALVANFAKKTDINGEIGKISYVPATAPNVNHLPVFGAEYSRTTYADLYAFAVASGLLVTDAVFATRPGCFGYGSGGVGGTTFRVPKIAGLVIKSYHNGDGTYTTDVTSPVGLYLPDEVKSHSHTTPFPVTNVEGPDGNRVSGGANANINTIYTNATGGAENTVRSVILYPQIRYK